MDNGLKGYRSCDAAESSASSTSTLLAFAALEKLKKLMQQKPTKRRRDSDPPLTASTIDFTRKFAALDVYVWVVVNAPLAHQNRLYRS